MIRALASAALVLVTGACFSPSFPECTIRCGAGCPEGTSCGPPLDDGFCHAPTDVTTCAALPHGDAAVGPDARLLDAPPRPDAGPTVDAPLAFPDARVIDAPPAPDARIIDAPLAIDARPLADAKPSPDAAPQPDAMTPAPDARDCTISCADPRTCGTVDGCNCGNCLSAEWCGDFCDFAICEETRCCLATGSPCDTGAGQCCDGDVCLSLCVPI